MPTMTVKKLQKKAKLRNAEYFGLQEVLDRLYAQSAENKRFTVLMELVAADENILLAYRNISKNKGSKTAGTDGKTVRYLSKFTNTALIHYIKRRLEQYQPQPVRRVEIPKGDTGKTRPLGIPTIADRLIQQCFLQILEPICEAKFHERSNGFRPNRSAEHALAQCYAMIQKRGLHYVVDIDIKGFFDNVSHGKLLKQMWNMGIQDKRVLSIISAMLKAEGSYILPDNVPSNEFLNLEGDKISTSRNWAVWLHEYLADFPGKQDVLRYVLTANAPETKDNDFTWKDFQARNNNELVAVYGNFVNRAMVLTQKYFDGCVPAQGELTDYDKETLKEFADVKAEVEKLLDVFKFRDAQKEAMNLARIGNKYLADTEPWKLAKTDMERVGTILNISLQLVANLAIAFDPFLPFSSEKLRKMLNMDTFEWSELGKDNLLPVGHQLNKPELLFEKIEDATIEAQVQKLLDTKKANEEASYKANPIRANIEFDDFTKLDIRVGTILECQKVPKADKLLQFKIDDGLETRTIVSGIAKHYKPEELVGKQVCFIANLAPRKLKGIVSEGMILSAENNDGSLAVIMPEREVKPGSEVK